MMNNKTYLCDPEKNTTCSKALCFEHGGPCGTTDDVRFAMRDFLGAPAEIVDEDFKIGGDEHGRMERH